MTRINTNISSLIAQKTLAKSNAQLQTALTRLSTGLQINTGKDDPAGMIASEALGMDITSTDQAIKNSEMANQMIATADSALSEVSSLLNDIKGLITEAANKGAMSDEQIAANQLQIDSSLDAINRIAQTTSFQGRNLLDGSLDFTTSATSGMATVRTKQINSANLGTAGYMDVSVAIQDEAKKASITSTIPTSTAAVGATSGLFTTNITPLSSLTFDAHTDGAEGNKIRVDIVHTDTVAADEIVASYNYDDVNDLHVVTVRLNNATADYDLAAIEAAVEGVNDNTGTQLLDVTEAGGGAGVYDATQAEPALIELTTGADAIAGLNGDLTFELSGKTGSQVFSFESGTLVGQIATAINLLSDATGVEATVAGDVLTLNSTAYGSDAFVAIKEIADAGAFTTSASRAVGEDIEATVNGVTATGKGNTLSINTATLSMSATVNDGSDTAFVFRITGGGALFQLGPDVVSNQQSRLGIQSVNTATLGGESGLLYSLGTGGAAALDTNTTLADQIVDEVATQVTSLRGRLGAFQATTIESNINSLTETLENLTAARSNIRDADFAAETANLTRAQILVQAGTSVLSIANQGPQSVLALLQ